MNTSSKEFSQCNGKDYSLKNNNMETRHNTKKISSYLDKHVKVLQSYVLYEASYWLRFYKIMIFGLFNLDLFHLQIFV